MKPYQKIFSCHETKKCSNYQDLSQNLNHFFEEKHKTDQIIPSKFQFPLLTLS
jgi:hypothetical protein